MRPPSSCPTGWCSRILLHLLWRRLPGGRLACWGQQRTGGSAKTKRTSNQKLTSPAAGQVGALCHCLGCYSPRFQSVWIPWQEMVTVLHSSLFIIIIFYFILFLQLELSCIVRTGSCITLVTMTCCIRSSWTSSNSTDIESHSPARIVLSNRLIMRAFFLPSANHPACRRLTDSPTLSQNQGAGRETPRLRFLSWLSVNICSLMSHLAELLMLSPSKYRSARMCVSDCVWFWPGFCRCIWPAILGGKKNKTFDFLTVDTCNYKWTTTCLRLFFSLLQLYATWLTLAFHFSWVKEWRAHLSERLNQWPH